VLASTAAHAARLESWRFNANQNQLEFTTDNGVQPRAQLMSNPTRLVIDLPGIALGRPGVTEPVGGLIQSVRIGQYDRETTRMVVELAPGYTIDPGQVKFRGITAQRWSVTLPKPQLMPGAVPSPAANFPSSSVIVGGKPANAPVIIPDPRGSGKGSWIGSVQTVPPAIANPYPANPEDPYSSTPQLTQPPLTRPSVGGLRVIIDPGHGGPDPGAIGIGGLQEKGVVLDISNRLANALQQQGIQATLTRPDDRDLDLEPRVDMAEQSNATVFVSIHANAIDASRPEVNGIETYYYQTGEELARTIHQSVVQLTGSRDRGVRTARFYVLRNTSMPSVLVEVGFVTGREDAPRLANPAYRSQVADGIARGILQYLQRTAQR
jgi:N-acetylmuramoyl-L-alanine amidase